MRSSTIKKKQEQEMAKIEEALRIQCDKIEEEQEKKFKEQHKPLTKG